MTSTILANPADAHFAGGFTYTPFGGGWFDFVLPFDYVTGSDITVQLQALLFNLPDPGGLTPDSSSCYIWGWGAQFNDGAITGATGTYLGGPPTLVPGSVCVPFIRLPVGAHTDEPIQHLLTSVNALETVQFIVPGTNETSFTQPGYCGWIVGDAGSPPAGPLPPGTAGQGVTYPDASDEALANSFFLGTPSNANNGYTGSSTLGAYQVIAETKTLAAGDTISILMQFSSLGSPGPALQAGTTSITVITSGSRQTTVPLTDVYVGFMSGNSGIATTHGTISPEYAVNSTYPDVDVNSPWVPLYDGAYSNLYLVSADIPGPTPTSTPRRFLAQSRPVRRGQNRSGTAVVPVTDDARITQSGDIRITMEADIRVILP